MVRASMSRCGVEHDALAVRGLVGEGTAMRRGCSDAVFMDVAVEATSAVVLMVV
jgi:hypothetical protein